MALRAAKQVDAMNGNASEGSNEHPVTVEHES